MLISTKCAGMGSDIPDIRLTVCVGESLNFLSKINNCVQGSPRMYGSFHRCLDEEGVTENQQLLWFWSGLARLVGRTYFCIVDISCLIRRPWSKQVFGQSAVRAKCEPPELSEGSHQCSV